MDKEALKKNQFWYLLGGFGLVWLILWVCAMVSGSEAGEKNKKEEPEKKKSLTEWNSKTPKNDKFIKPWNKHRDNFAAQKDTVWRQAWDTQASFYVWPNNLPDGTDFNQVMLYAADTKKSLQDDVRKREEYATTYANQFRDLDKLVAPAYFGDAKAAGNGGGFPAPGQGGGGGSGSENKEKAFKVMMGPAMAAGGSNQGGGRGGVLGPNAPNAPGAGGEADGVPFDAVLTGKNELPPPTPEEIWILQEDFWVKQEMLHIIRAVQQSVSHFAKEDVKKDEEKPAGVQADAVVKRFSNGVWEFTLYIEQPKDASLPVISAKSTIKNISPSHAVQPLSSARGSKPLAFYLIQGTVRYEMKVTGEPLAWNVPYPIGQRAPDNLNLSKDFELEQDFDWSNAPVRRVDTLRTARQSHRTAKKPLEPNPIFQTTATVTPGAPSPAPRRPNGPNARQHAPNPGGPPKAELRLTPRM